MHSLHQDDVHSSPPDYVGENCNIMLPDKEKGEIKSDSRTPNGAVEEDSGTAMMVATEKEEESKYAPVAISPLETQPHPSVDQRVEYQMIDIKKTKVSWSHDSHMTQHSHIHVHP